MSPTQRLFLCAALSLLIWLAEQPCLASAVIKDAPPASPAPLVAPSNQPIASPAPTPPATASIKPWYERLSIRGYAQFRYNRLLETNSAYRNTQQDSSIGENGGFLIRRGRVVIFGDFTDRLSLYSQTDLAGENQNLSQIRDLSVDWALDSRKEYRIRLGQNKLPFGFENLQSSSNRIPMDRTEALNSANPGERDVGVALLWAPAEIRERFKRLAATHKGSGDYGAAALMLSNGQSINRIESNNNRRVTARLSWPFALPSSEQIVELGVQGYAGQFTIAGATLDDTRTAASLIWYPQPWGFQAEWNFGRGPAWDTTERRHTAQRLRGGYAMILHRSFVRERRVILFSRYQSYRGGWKGETSSPLLDVNELETGFEAELVQQLELTIGYAAGHRILHSSTTANDDRTGQLLRVQVQASF